MLMKTICYYYIDIIKTLFSKLSTMIVDIKYKGLIYSIIPGLMIFYI